MDSASQGTSVRRRELCRYHASGRCFRGQSCKFSHDQAASAGTPRQRAPQGVCWKFFHNGVCHRANTAAGCKYRHERPVSTNTATANSSTSQTRSSRRERRLPAGDSTRLNNTQPSPRAAAAIGSPAAVPVPVTIPPAAVPITTIPTQQHSRTSNAPTALTTQPRPPAAQIRTITTSSLQTVISSQLPGPSQLSGQRRIGATVSGAPSTRVRPVSVAFSREQAVANPVANAEKDTCAICFDEPAMYGLLCQCRHVFCWKCINGWRSSDQASAKKCPVCRVHSCHHVISDTFISGEGDASRRRKQQLFASHCFVDSHLARASYAPNPYQRRSDSWWDDPPRSSSGFVPGLTTSTRPAPQAASNGRWPDPPPSWSQAQAQRSSTFTSGQTPPQNRTYTFNMPRGEGEWRSIEEVRRRQQQEQQRLRQANDTVRPGAVAVVVSGIAAAAVAAYRWWRPG